MRQFLWKTKITQKSIKKNQFPNYHILVFRLIIEGITTAMTTNSGLVGTLPYGLWQGNNKQKAWSSSCLHTQREIYIYDQFIIKMSRQKGYFKLYNLYFWVSSPVKIASIDLSTSSSPIALYLFVLKQIFSQD